jgi:hypothetical protein
MKRIMLALSPSSVMDGLYHRTSATVAAVRRRPRRGGNGFGVRSQRDIGRGVAIFVAVTAVGLSVACSDPVGPRSHNITSVKSARPDILIDWYNCASYDGGVTWSCEYDHTEWQSTGGGPYIAGPGLVNNVPGNCTSNSSLCTDAYHNGGGATPPGNPVPTSGLGSLTSGYCLDNWLCSPAESAAGSNEYCSNGGLAGLCTPSEFPDLYPKVYAGKSGTLNGCPSGTTTFRLSGTWAGEPATYFIGAYRSVYLGATLGFEELAIYGAVVEVTTASGVRKYGGPMQVDCTTGVFIGLGIPR